MMRYYPRLSVFSVIAAAPLTDLAMHLRSPWNEKIVKHMWDTTPTDWESQGPPTWDHD